MENKAREILRVTLAGGEILPSNLSEAVRRRFADMGGVKLEIPPREPMREPPGFDR